MKTHATRRFVSLMMSGLWLSVGLALAENAKMIFEPDPEALMKPDSVVEDGTNREADDAQGHPKEIDWDALLKAGVVTLEVDVFSGFYYPEKIRLFIPSNRSSGISFRVRPRP